jgi:hypothetical protein
VQFIQCVFFLFFYYYFGISNKMSGTRLTISTVYILALIWNGYLSERYAVPAGRWTGSLITYQTSNDQLHVSPLKLSTPLYFRWFRFFRTTNNTISILLKYESYNHCRGLCIFTVDAVFFFFFFFGWFNCERVTCKIKKKLQERCRPMRGWQEISYV